jgi:hypothetical protein
MAFNQVFARVVVLAAIVLCGIPNADAAALQWSLRSTNTAGPAGIVFGFLSHCVPSSAATTLRIASA